MNPARKEDLILRVACAIDRDAIEPGIEARVLARAVVSLVQERTPQESLELSAEIEMLHERCPRKVAG